MFMTNLIERVRTTHLTTNEACAAKFVPMTVEIP